MPHVLKRIDPRSERGISMFLTVVAMLLTTMFVAAAFAAANGDLPVSGVATERKSSYAAAEGGLNFYLNRLQQDPDYWTKCDTGDAPNTGENNPINQLWDGKSPDTRKWRSLPGSTDEYTIELVPAPGYTKCEVGKQQTFVDLNTGTFKVRVTARSFAGKGRTRTILATFRRDSFLNFVYFTNYENRDPSAEDDSTERARQVNECADKYRSARAGHSCVEIQFATGDKLNGPVHTNDESLLICGTPAFGRLTNEDLTPRATKTDTVEVRGGGTGHVANTGCSDSPTINTTTGAFTVNAKQLSLPESNKELKAVASNSASLYSGVTKIRLRDDVMDITDRNGNLSKGVKWPTSGVLYVDNLAGSCEGEIPTRADYDEPSSCGNVYVSGTYSLPLTIAAANDIIIKPTDPVSNPGDADLKQSGTNDAVLGLIANNFVRVAHRVNRSTCDNSTAEPLLTNVRIEAAILALQHSFIVDNYTCGKLGKLTVEGAIVQKYRGTVGTGSATAVNSGYLKNYWYDDRFRYRSPPYFLSPVDAAWDIVRSHEYVR